MSDRPKCRYCGKTWPDAFELRAHVRLEHPAEFDAVKRQLNDWDEYTGRRHYERQVKKELLIR